MPTDLVTQVLGGSRRALARLLTRIENNDAQQELSQLYAHTGKGWVIGVTGAPGAGKSSLVNALAKVYRAQNKSVAILAVDPTSPFSGGAILGDRIRMRDLSGDSGIFIRSMATRGNLGGLAHATRDMVRAMDAAGFDIILVETVGAGQSEVDIVRMAYTTLVVEAPGMGDDVQAIKAGILEIADILVVNKADRAGANQTVRALKAMLELGHPTQHLQWDTYHGSMMSHSIPMPDQTALWVSPVLQTVATDNHGIAELIQAIDEHRQYRQNTGIASILEARYIESELFERLQIELMKRFIASVRREDLEGLIQMIRSRKMDPQTAIEQLILQTVEHNI